jgi:molybdenum cofactor guanylyltransferase
MLTENINRNMPDLFDYICNSSVQCYHLGMNAAGFVLVGGQSRRLGQDKALLPWHDGVLVESVARAVCSTAGSVVLIGAPDRYRHLPFLTVEDRRKGCGPLAGIETALALQIAEYNLICACDMPHLSLQMLQGLLQYAQTCKAGCTLVVDGAGRSHPLCAVYHQSCLAAVTNALNQDQLRLHDLTRGLRSKTFSVLDSLANVNTPEEWALAGGRF